MDKHCANCIYRCYITAGLYCCDYRSLAVLPCKTQSQPLQRLFDYLPVLTRPPENGGNDMSKIYMAVTVCQDKNETTLPREHTRNAAPVITLMFCHARPGKTSNLRLIASADCRSPTFAAPKKRRRSL